MFSKQFNYETLNSLYIVRKGLGLAWLPFSKRYTCKLGFGLGFGLEEGRLSDPEYQLNIDTTGIPVICLAVVFPIKISLFWVSMV